MDRYKTRGMMRKWTEEQFTKERVTCALIVIRIKAQNNTSVKTTLHLIKIKKKSILGLRSLCL
jgi:hypothetical protein